MHFVVCCIFFGIVSVPLSAQPVVCNANCDDSGLWSKQNVYNQSKKIYPTAFDVSDMEKRSGKNAFQDFKIPNSFQTLLYGSEILKNCFEKDYLRTENPEHSKQNKNSSSFIVTRSSLDISSSLIIAINPPTLNADSICQYNINPINGGLKAACDPCTGGAAPKIFWYDASGNKVGEGSPFNPIALKIIDPAVAGIYNFTAVCICGNTMSAPAAVSFKVIAVPQPKISGNNIVCPGETTTYSTPLTATDNYNWTLSGGGKIIAVNQNTIQIQWNSTPNTGPFTLKVNETNTNGCAQYFSLDVLIKQTNLACIGSVNVSVDNTCKTVLTADFFSASKLNGSGSMKLQILAMKNGQIFEEGIGNVTVDGMYAAGNYVFIGRTLYYNIIENCTGSSCGGNVTFQDFTPPTLTAPADTSVSCAQIGVQNIDPSISGVPQISDCSTTTTYFSDNYYTTSCSTPFKIFPTGFKLATRPVPPIFPYTNVVKIIVRTFTVTDKYGNASMCEQIIYVLKTDLTHVVCPPDYETECQNAGALTPNITGYPKIDIDGNFATTTDTVSINAGSCNFAVSYTDDTTKLCAGSYQITRTWNFFDPCATIDPKTQQNNQYKTCIQIIKVTDKTPPNATVRWTQFYVINNDLKARDTTIVFDGFTKQNGSVQNSAAQDVWALGNGNTCGGTIRFVLRATDFYCTHTKTTFSVNDSRVQQLGIQQFDINSGETVALYEANFDGIGDYKIIFSVSDECGFAQAKKILIVKVRDNVKPQPVCPSNLRVSLNSVGTARTFTSSFNSGSTDNCGIDNLKIRRMSNCLDPANTNFGDYVDFSCCDATDTVRVVLRVTDYAGNYNDCMVRVVVDNKSTPTCLPPSDKTVACTDTRVQNSISTLSNAFGAPSFWDNCGVRDTIYTSTTNLNNCKIGTITRKWVITSISNAKDSCTQTINVTPVSDFTVDFPDDLILDCYQAFMPADSARNALLSNSINADGHIINNGCGILAVDVKDQVFTAVSDACAKILRKFTVIDWCKYNPNNGVSALSSNAYGQPIAGDIHSNPNWATDNLSAWQNLGRPAGVTDRDRLFRDADGLTGPPTGNTTQPYSYSDGIISFTQIIKIIDKTPPVFTNCVTDTTVKSYNADACSDLFRFMINAVDYCSGSNSQPSAFGSPQITGAQLIYSWVLFDVKNNIAVKTGTTQNFAEILNFNQAYEIRWMVQDPCNNTAQCTTKVKIVNAKKPALTCKDVQAELMPTADGKGAVTVWAKEITVSLTHNCATTDQLFNNLAIERGNSDINAVYPTVVNKNLVFNCNDLINKIPVRVWTKDTVGNANYCVVNVAVQDNLQVCQPVIPTAVLSGGVKTESNIPINNSVVMSSNGTQPIGKMTTGQTGNFSFSNLAVGQKLSLSASKDDDYTNGVTTYDISLMSRHILGIKSLNTPYKIIAADVNRDGEVSAIDLLFMRRLVLRISSTFPNNTAWRFIDKKYIFSDPQNPLYEDFPETVNSTIQSGINNADFIGVKVGDVNGSADPSSLQDVQVRTVTGNQNIKPLQLFADDTELKAGGEYVLEVRAKYFNINGFQFTLNTTEDIEVEQILKGDFLDITDANFGKFANALTVSWNGVPQTNAGMVFKLIVKARKDILLSNALSIGSNLTANETFDFEGKTGEVRLQFNANGTTVKKEGFQLYQNAPNPFDEATKIGFTIPKNCAAKLSIYDAAGRSLKTIEGNYPAGFNEIIIQKSDLNATGILFYRLDTPTHCAVKKMVIGG